MPLCHKCAAKLTKRKSEMIYYCRRHGVIRKIGNGVKPETEKNDPKL